MLPLSILPSQRRLDAPRQRARAIARARDALAVLWEAATPHGCLPGDGGVEAALFQTAVSAARLPPYPLPDAEQRRAALSALSGAAKLVCKLLAAAGGRDAAPLFCVAEPPMPAPALTPSDDQRQPASLCLVRALAAAASSSSSGGAGRRKTELLRDLVVAAGLALGLRAPHAAHFRDGWRWGPDEPGADDRDAELARPLVGLALGVARALAVVAEDEEDEADGSRRCPYCSSSSSGGGSSAASSADARASLAAVFSSRRAKFALWSLCSSSESSASATALMLALSRAQARALARGHPFPNARRFASEADSLAGSDEDRNAETHASDARLVSKAAVRLALSLMMARSGAGGAWANAVVEHVLTRMTGESQQFAAFSMANPARFAESMAEAAANDPATAATILRSLGLRGSRRRRRGSGEEEEEGEGEGGGSDGDDEQEEEGEEQDKEEEEEEEDEENATEEEDEDDKAQARLDATLDTSVFFAPEDEPTAAEARAIPGAVEGRRATEEVKPSPPAGHPFAAFDSFLPPGEGCILALGEEALERAARTVVGVAAAGAVEAAAAPSSPSSPHAPTMLVLSLNKDKAGAGDDDDSDNDKQAAAAAANADAPQPQLRWPGPPLEPSLALATLAHHVTRALVSGDEQGVASLPLGEIWEGRTDFADLLGLVAAGEAAVPDALPPPRRCPGGGGGQWGEALFPAAAAARQSAEACVLIAHGASRCVPDAAASLMRECAWTLVGALVVRGAAARAREQQQQQRQQQENELAALGQQAFSLRAAALAALFRGRAPATQARRQAEWLLGREMHLIAEAIAAGAGALRRRRGWGFAAADASSSPEEEGSEPMATDGEGANGDQAAAAAAARRALGAAVVLFVLGERLAPVAEGCPPLFPAFIAGGAGGGGAAAGGGGADGKDDDEGRGAFGTFAIIRALESKLGEAESGPEEPQQEEQQQQDEEQPHQAGPSAAAAAAKDAAADNDEGAAAAASTICALKTSEEGAAAATEEQQLPPSPPPKPVHVLDLLCSAIADAALLFPPSARAALLSPAPDNGASLPSLYLTRDDEENEDGGGEAASNLGHSKRRAEDEEFARQAMRHPREAGDAEVLARADALAAQLRARALRRVERLWHGPKEAAAADVEPSGGGSNRKAADAMERDDEDDEEDDDDEGGGADADAAASLHWSDAEDDDDDAKDLDADPDAEAIAIASGIAADARAATLTTLGFGEAALEDESEGARIGSNPASAAARRRRLRAYCAAVISPSARLLVTHCATPKFGAIFCARVAKALSVSGALPAVAALLVTSLWRREGEGGGSAAGGGGGGSGGGGGDTPTTTTTVGACGFFSAPTELAALLKPLASFDAPGPVCVALLSLLERAFAVGAPAAADAWVTAAGRRRRRKRAEVEEQEAGEGGGGGQGDGDDGDGDEEEAAAAAAVPLPPPPLVIADLQGERTILLALFHLLARPPQDQAWARHVQGACARVASVLLRRHCEAALAALAEPSSSSSPPPPPSHHHQAPTLGDAARWCAQALELLRRMSDELLRVKMSRSLSAEALQNDVAGARAELARALLRLHGARAEAKAKAKEAAGASKEAAPGLQAMVAAMETEDDG